MSLPIVYHPDYMAPLRTGHRFPMSKYGYLRAHLVRQGLLPETGGYLAPAPASLSQVAAAQGWDYADRAFRLSLPAAKVREIGQPQSEAGAGRAGRLRACLGAESGHTSRRSDWRRIRTRTGPDRGPTRTDGGGSRATCGMTCAT